MIRTEDFEQVTIDSSSALHGWLKANHAQRESVWLVTWKSHDKERYVSRDEVLDELICFGWIDGIRRKLDRDRTMQLISPRKVLHWAATYKQRAERLEREGRMRPEGRAKIEESRVAGMWDAMAEVDALRVPSDLEEALLKNQPARDHFHASSPSYRRNVLRWIQLAKKPETRAKRVERAVAFARDDKRMPQF